MSLILRFVDSFEIIRERFLDLIHVANTRLELLMVVIVSTLSRNSLLLFCVRRQKYDKASNMCENINGLKTIIQRKVPSAYYVHCFAHRIQLALISKAKNHIKVCRFFVELSSLCVTVGVFCKRADLFQELCSVTVSKAKVLRLLEAICSFDFVLMLYIMKTILSKSVVLFEALQRKDQDILNAMNLVGVTKYELQEMRSEEVWKAVYEAVQSLCLTKNIAVRDMESIYVLTIHPRRNADNITYNHYYHVEIFLNIKSINYHLVLRLISLALTLPVSTMSIERCFSTLKIVKMGLMNKMEDEYLADAIGTFVERELAQGITTDVIIEKFQMLNTQCLHLD
ncbi:hypothetical protein MPTK1_5g12630 [Marchantia polymorpha subsp. ruderalis]|uniref:HAT C-terminal dimerisation domain-containing protein n=2 Tax=Marchantia polymorpha TaxID=3197 RepID=A0AAF6BHN4_MARPO|nr:hypothetical protein MARPO_0092s0045 [Marchantia polymorpha]BBN11518.1 hypothetical protein Mp_5g12630 [Marchantia polymorpha subsp. ruderalis]|eukprot:PTQ33083.1 hypothetical protein MARPO_0092s0045 [Marchantia polymorpha]